MRGLKKGLAFFYLDKVLFFSCPANLLRFNVGNIIGLVKPDNVDKVAIYALI